MPSANHVDVKFSGGGTVLGMAEAARAINSGQLSVAAYLDDCLAVIEARNETIAALVEVDEKRVRRRAYVLDRMPTDKRGPAHGIPFAAARVIDVLELNAFKGQVETSNRVAQRDATIIKRAYTAGGIAIAAATSAEFGCFGMGIARNPRDPERASRGSGAAAAVAANMVPFAFDARADGSVTLPADYCGIYGLTATRGAIASDGILSLAPSVESRGFYVRKAEDIGFACRLFLATRPLPEVREELAYRTVGMAVHVLDGPMSYRVETAGRSAINRATAALSDGHVAVGRLRLPPRFVKMESCYNTLLSYEVARQLTAERDRMSAKMNDETRALVDRGRRIDASEYEQARRDAITLRSELLDMMPGDTVFLDAAAESVPPLRGSNENSNALQALWAIAGLPVLSIPCGTVGGLPVGVQIAAAPGREDLLARLACIIEDRLTGG